VTISFGFLAAMGGLGGWTAVTLMVRQVSISSFESMRMRNF
jgi:hypothetical protein